jgi:hypothetical protein
MDRKDLNILSFPQRQMKKCPFCWEKIQTTAKKCRFCWERLGQEESKSSKWNNKWIVRRLLKLTYFLFSIPIALFLILVTMDNSQIYHGGIKVANYYQLIINIILIILWYILVTDFSKRVYAYLAEWKFEGFLKIKNISKNSKIWIIILMIILGLLSIGSYKLNNECTGSNEQFNDNWVCWCKEGYIREWAICSITIGKTIMNVLPAKTRLREIKQLPSDKSIYIGLYVEEWELMKPSEDTNSYTDCYWEVEGQWMKWDYYIFSFQNWIITSKIKVPLGFRESYNGETNKLIFPIENTKINNYNFFKWKKPIDESDMYNMELTSLINFEDYNWDWIKNEFYLLDHRDQVCGHNNYLIAWFDNTSKKVLVYWMSNKWNISYRWDNFIPDSKWNVRNWRECGDHWSATEMKNIFKFDKEKNMYVLISGKERQCSESEL